MERRRCEAVQGERGADRVRALLARDWLARRGSENWSTPRRENLQGAPGGILPTRDETLELAPHWGSSYAVSCTGVLRFASN